MDIQRQQISRPLVVLGLVLLVLGNLGLQLHEPIHHPIGVDLAEVAYGQTTNQFVVGHNEPLTTLHLEAPVSIRTLACTACALHQQLRGSHLPHYGSTLLSDQTDSSFVIGSSRLLLLTLTSASPRGPPFS